MDIVQRRDKIKEIILDRQEVQTSELVDMFNVSSVTLRSDLIYLERIGICKRLFGKVVACSGGHTDENFELVSNIDEKERIGKAAAKLIEEGDAVLFYTGTTTRQVTRFIDPDLDFIAVTNSLQIAAELQKLPNAQVVILGGTLHPRLGATFGVQTIQQVRSFNFDKLFISVDGVDAKMGITNAMPFESELNQVVTECAKKTIVVADHTKVGAVSFVQMGGVDAVDTLITDSTAKPEAVEALRKAGVEVIIV